MTVPLYDTPVARWQARMGWSDRMCAQELGMTLAGYQRQKTGRDEHGKPRKPSKRLLLACAALEAGLDPVL